MKLRSSLKILPFKEPISSKIFKLNKGKQAGSLTVLVSLLFVIFAIVCLAIVLLAQIHLNISRSRKNSNLLDYACENGIKEGYQKIAHLIESRNGFIPVEDNLIKQLKTAPATGFAQLVSTCFGDSYPVEIENAAGSISWKSSALLSVVNFEDYKSFIKVNSALNIQAEGRLNKLPHRHLSTLEGKVVFLAGNLPANLVTLAIKQEMSAEQKLTFLADNNINFPEPQNRELPPLFLAGQNQVLPVNFDETIRAALRIKMFKPQELTSYRLREILGLEKNSQPVPESVYLIEDDLGLGAIFVQGDLDELIFAIQEKYQLIVFRMAGQEWILKFSPGLKQTEFRTPESTKNYDLLPNGYLIINGQIKSVGGGRINSTGTIELVKEEDVVSILNGVRLTLISSGQVKISSSLIAEGVSWKKGIPYLDTSASQVMILTTGRELTSGERQEADIIIDGTTPTALKINASLLAAEDNFVIKGEGKKVTVTGSIQSSNYRGNSNSLDLVPDRRLLDSTENYQLPASTTPVLMIYSITPENWKEY